MVRSIVCLSSLHRANTHTAVQQVTAWRSGIVKHGSLHVHPQPLLRTNTAHGNRSISSSQHRNMRRMHASNPLTRSSFFTPLCIANALLFTAFYSPVQRLVTNTGRGMHIKGAKGKSRRRSSMTSRSDAGGAGGAGARKDNGKTRGSLAPMF
jgi:hypothetical protein